MLAVRTRSIVSAIRIVPSWGDRGDGGDGANGFTNGATGERRRTEETICSVATARVAGRYGSHDEHKHKPFGTRSTACVCARRAIEPPTAAGSAHILDPFAKHASPAFAPLREYSLRSSPFLRSS